MNPKRSSRPASEPPHRCVQPLALATDRRKACLTLPKNASGVREGFLGIGCVRVAGTALTVPGLNRVLSESLRLQPEGGKGFVVSAHDVHQSSNIVSFRVGTAPTSKGGLETLLCSLLRVKARVVVLTRHVEHTGRNEIGPGPFNQP